jgi:hypothetical protein
VSDLEIEKLGGLAGFGPRSRVRSHGRVSHQALSDADRATVERLFAQGGVPAKVGTADAFRYQITRQTPTGPQTIEVAEHAIPEALAASVHDELN